MNLQHTAARCAAYAWAGPNSLIGVIGGCAMLCFGARVQRVAGVLEVHGGTLGRWFANRPHPYCFAAITFGHVILATDLVQLDSARRHEHVHVRQYERWGVLILPAYALSSLHQLLRGRRWYRDNRFEREAYAIDADCERDDTIA